MEKWKVLVELLNAEEKKEFVREFQNELKDLTEDKVISVSWYYKMLRENFAPSDNVILEVIKRSERARRWIIMKSREKCKRVEEVLSELDVSHPSKT
ncbi:hypothetical protein [Sulfurisphaera ohwakuensis]|uniref:hypothetical protein n=1 Tax=Sulfurisphaera ohwakuensis TaxID=69656 RepID=UPI0036F2EE40